MPVQNLGSLYNKGKNPVEGQAGVRALAKVVVGHVPGGRNSRNKGSEAGDGVEGVIGRNPDLALVLPRVSPSPDSSSLASTLHSAAP